jgi:hypothetical protein
LFAFKAVEMKGGEMSQRDFLEFFHFSATERYAPTVRHPTAPENRPMQKTKWRTPCLKNQSQYLPL